MTESKLKDLARRQKQVHILPEERVQKLIKKYNLPEACREAIIEALKEAYRRGHNSDVICYKSAEYVDSALEEPPVLPAMTL